MAWLRKRRKQLPQQVWVPVAFMRRQLRVRSVDIHQMGYDAALERAQRRFRGV